MNVAEAAAPEAAERRTAQTESDRDQRQVEQVVANAGTLTPGQIDMLRALLPPPADRAET